MPSGDEGGHAAEAGKTRCLGLVISWRGRFVAPIPLESGVSYIACGRFCFDERVRGHCIPDSRSILLRKREVHHHVGSSFCFTRLSITRIEFSKVLLHARIDDPVARTILVTRTKILISKYVVIVDSAVLK